MTKLKQALIKNSVTWIFEENDHWTVKTDQLYKDFPSLPRFKWIEGTVEPELEIESEEKISSNLKRKETTVQFMITKREVKLSMPKKIFLSHKNCDKPLVREYFEALKEIGFKPWLDEDEMVAGSPLERALIAGMKDSCAAVFFITPNYVDKSFLASEINYAMEQKREKENRFSIITIVLTDKEGRKGNVPDLLKQYVWKEPKNNLQGLKEIIRALPIEVKQISWKNV